MQQAGVDQGAQYQSPERRMEPACGFDKAERARPGRGAQCQAPCRRPAAPLRIGVVGLGAGMVAAHGRPGDMMRYYELNPAVLDLVDRHFTFREGRQGHAPTSLLGDGRLVLERQLQAGDAQGFDVLVLNAFRGASPPMHLMTKEAFDIYLAHLAEPTASSPSTSSSRSFEMAPLHRGMARQLGLDVRWFEPQGRRRLRGRDQLGALHQGQGLLRDAAGQGRGLAAGATAAAGPSWCGPTATAT